MGVVSRNELPSEAFGFHSGESFSYIGAFLQIAVCLVLKQMKSQRLESLDSSVLCKHDSVLNQNRVS
jgi:hypothetical protein